MNTLEVLKAARERIAVPERWTQGAFARTAAGHPTNGGSDFAVCWCALGALMTGDDSVDGAQVEARTQLVETIGQPKIGQYNDTHEHADVLAMFDKTIARLESESTT